MNPSSRKNRRHLSALLAVVMILGSLIALPLPAQAGLLGTVGGLVKSGVNLAGSVAAAYMGGVLGIALGGGPIGMVVGAAAGYWLGGKVMKWTTANWGNFSLVAGAAMGAVLTFGSGLPLLGIGIVGGALIGRGLVWACSKIKSLFTKKQPSTAEQAEGYLKELTGGGIPPLPPPPPTTAAPVTPATPKPAAPPMDAQEAYKKYMAAFKVYMDATSKGDSAAAQAAYADYQKYMGLYQEAMKAK